MKQVKQTMILIVAFKRVVIIHLTTIPYSDKILITYQEDLNETVKTIALTPPVYDVVHSWNITLLVQGNTFSEH